MFVCVILWLIDVVCCWLVLVVGDRWCPVGDVCCVLVLCVVGGGVAVGVFSVCGVGCELPWLDGV